MSRRVINGPTIELKTEQLLEELHSRYGGRQPRLFALQGTDMGKTFPLGLTPNVIGRDPEVAVPLWDGAISRRHAQIYYDEEKDTFLLEDLGSRNGTLHNGLRTSLTELQHGDLVALGSTVLRFTLEDPIEASYQQHIDRLVHIDDLTGLVLKRRFDTLFDSAVSTAQSQDFPLTVLMMDMDHLKEINDTHGHQYGAYAISEVGRLIKEVVGERGIATRFGGDEFTAYLTNMERKRGLEVAEEICRRVRRYPFEKDKIRIYPTISIGASFFPDDGLTPEELIHAADEALYRAKKSGRDCVFT